MDEEFPAIALAREITGANRVEAVAYGTEGGHFQRHGIPAVICGPGSIDQAHKPDEYCELSGIRCLRSLPAQSDREGERVTSSGLAPALLQIAQERLKPGAETLYGETEERIARFCADNKCPNRYLALASIDLPREVWWLNEFSSSADMDRVTQFYTRNEALTAAMRELALGKEGLTEKPVDQLTSFRPDLSGRNDWQIGGLPFTVIRAMPVAERVPGTVFATPDGKTFAFAAASTRAEADRLAAILGDGAALFEVRPAWSYPSREWILRNPELWKR